jgi:hypothetical protein
MEPLWSPVVATGGNQWQTRPRKCRKHPFTAAGGHAGRRARRAVVSVYTGPQVTPVNIVAPYLLTALLYRPQRLVYLSSGAHRSGRANLDGIDWTGRAVRSYSDSKLFVTTLAFAVARLWPDVFSNAVDPGWVPTRMGGPGAPDDLRLGHVTQEWLATSEDPEARTSSGYWYHQRRIEPHAAVHDRRFQDQLLELAQGPSRRGCKRRESRKCGQNEGGKRTSSDPPTSNKTSMVRRGSTVRVRQSALKRPANGLFCCLDGVRPSLERPSTCPQNLSPPLQAPWSFGLSEGV